MNELLLIILGLIGLWLGSKLVISGISDIAKQYKISQLFLGLTILAFGTDLPELFVVITSALERLNGTETSGLVIGETIGTSISQSGLMLGIIGLLTTIIIPKKTAFRDGLTLVISVFILILLGLDGVLSKTDGVILLLTYVIYFSTVYREEKIFEKILRSSKIYISWSLVSLFLGFAILIYSSNLTVDAAIKLSQIFGIKQSLIGLLIIGPGTSLPELATSLAAIKNKSISLAVGNLIGSSIFDVLFVLGIGVSISEFIFIKELLLFDALILFTISFLVFLFLINQRLGRKESFLLISIYSAYFVYKFISLVTHL